MLQRSRYGFSENIENPVSELDLSDDAQQDIIVSVLSGYLQH